MYFEEVFLKSFFCYSWAWSKKIWSFVEEIPSGLSNFILGAHRNFLRDNLFFRENVGFFYYFRLLSHFFDGLAITACYVSKYVSRKNIFFSWKRVFYHFRTMSRNFSDVRKFFSARCHKGILHIRKEDFKLKFVRKKILFHRFRTWRKWFFTLWKKKAKCHNCKLRVHGNSLMKIFAWKLLVFYLFWTFLHSGFLPKVFRNRCQVFLLTVQRNILRKSFFWKKYVFL